MTTQSIDDVLTSNSSPSEGNATLTMVVSRMLTNIPATKTAPTTYCWGIRSRIGAGHVVGRERRQPFRPELGDHGLERHRRRHAPRRIGRRGAELDPTEHLLAL